MHNIHKTGGYERNKGGVGGKWGDCFERPAQEATAIIAPSINSPFGVLTPGVFLAATNQREICAILDTLGASGIISLLPPPPPAAVRTGVGENRGLEGGLVC